MAILSLSVLALSNMALFSYQQSHNLDLQIRSIDLKTDIKGQMIDQISCENTLKNQDFSSVKTWPLQIKDKNDIVVFKAGDVTDGIKIKKIETEVSNPVPNTMNLAKVIVTLETESNVDTTVFKPYSILVPIQMDAASKVSGCIKNAMSGSGGGGPAPSLDLDDMFTVYDYPRVGNSGYTNFDAPRDRDFCFFNRVRMANFSNSINSQCEIRPMMLGPYEPNDYGNSGNKGSMERWYYTSFIWGNATAQNTCDVVCLDYFEDIP